MQSVTIRHIRFEQTGYARWEQDSLPFNSMRSLAERLLLDHPLTIRVNAPGTLATASVRGAGPARTPVFWNGLNIQSPQNGVIDLSLVPSWPGDRLEMRMGGQSAALSSGAMGGAILLEQTAPATSGFSGQLGVHAGSFSRSQIDAAAGWGNERFSTQTRISWLEARNNFSYTNTAKIGQPREQQRNNAQVKLDMQQHNLLIINKKNVLKTSLWHQRAFREIPPSMTAAAAETWQKDRNWRGSTAWEHRANRRQRWQTRLAFADESIIFRLAGTSDSSRARTVVLSSDYIRTGDRGFNWKAGLQATHQDARASGYSTGYAGMFTLSRLAAVGMMEKNGVNNRVSILLRQEWVSEGYAPLTWSLGIEQRLYRPVWLRMHLSRNFNLPTFNDRFWNTFGNPNLLPESGYSADAGVFFSAKAGLLRLKMEAGGYSLLIDDMILWQPGDDGLFRPGNLRQVWSRGLESGFRAETQLAAWKLACSGRYQQALATNVRVYNADIQALDKQLVYTPQHTGSLGFDVARWRWRMAYRHFWTGSRFTLSDNTRSLRGYNVGTWMLDCLWGKKKLRWSTELQVENVWNVSWQFFEYYPMPGRSWRVGCTFFI